MKIIQNKEKDIEDESISNSLKLDEEENNDEENGNYRRNKNIGHFPANSIQIFLKKNFLQKSQIKYLKNEV